VTEAEIRARFNAGLYYERVLAGELVAFALRPDHPARDGANQPPGTVSRQLAYYDRALRRVAVVHEYRLPDGTVGGSGRPDPKRLILDDEILFV